MVKRLHLLFICVIGLLLSQGAFAQCANDNTLVAGNLTPPGVGLSTTQSMNAGEYMLAQVIAGSNYTVTTCGGSSAFDTQITVYDNASGTLQAYNDDFCGLQSSVTFTPSFCGYVRILLDQYFCNASGLNTTVTMTLNSGSTSGPTLTAATDQAACPGGTVSVGISSNGSGGTMPYTYAWNPPAGLQNSTVAQTNCTVSTTTNYTLTMTDANGCTAVDSVLVTAYPVPTVALGPDVTQCGGSVTIDAGNPGDTYLWSTGAGTQTISVNASGAYSVAVSNSNGCVGTDQINVTINTPPSFSLAADTAQCGGSVALDAGTGFVSYVWGTGATTQMDTVSTTGNYYVTVTDANGCVLSDTQMVTINPAPLVLLGPDSTQCGGTITLDAGNPGSIYFWSNNTTNQTTNVSTSGTYSVHVVSLAGCQSDDTISVTINPIPFVVLGPDTSVCSTSLMLDAGNPGSTYAWSNSANTQTTTVSSSGTYSVLVTSPQGCTDQDTIVVALNSTPTITAGNDQSICSGSSASLTANGGATYVWSTGATTATTSVNPTITTTYYVTGTDANGCQATDVINIYVQPTPTASFTSVTTGVTVDFTNTSTNASSYSWNFGDSQTSTQQNPSHTYTTNGTYTVTLTVSGPCGTSTFTQTIVISGVGIADETLGLTLNLYPNPNNGEFTLKLDLEKEQQVQISVFDIRGAVLYSEGLDHLQNYNKQVSLRDVTPGMYFVRVQTTNGIVTRKFIVE